MNRNEYMKRVLPVISSLGEEKADEIEKRINTYLDEAGEENEAAALNALGVPEIFARRFVHTDGEYEITPFGSDAHSSDRKEDEHHSLFTHSEKMALKPRSFADSSHGKTSERKSTGNNSKRMLILLALLVITSPIWLCFMALFVLIALAFAFAVAAILMIMTVGGAALTVFGVIRIFSILPIGILMTGAGLLLLGISGIAFLPLLKSSVSLLCGTVKDIAIFGRNFIHNACETRAEVGR